MFVKLARALRYLFYRGYIHQLSQWKGDAKTAAIAATALMALAMYANFYTVALVISSAVGRKLPSEITIWPGLPSIKTAYAGVLVVLIMSQALYLYYMKSGRDRVILDEYSSEEMTVRRKRTIYVYTYIAGTVGLFIISLVITALSAGSS